MKALQKKNAGKVLASSACVVAVGLAIVFGNGLLSYTAFAEPEDNVPDQPASPAASEDTGTETVMPGDAVLKTCDDGTTVMLRYTETDGGYEATLTQTDPDGKTSEQSLTGEDAENMVKKFTADNKPTFVEGQPGEGDMSKDAATATARNVLVGKYALNDETLNRFTVCATLNVANAEQPVWQVVYTPTDNNDFAEIGSYMVLLDSHTGETLKTTSAADGIG